MSLSIAVIAGSLRAESFNRQLAEALIRLPAAQGHQFTFLDIGSLPLYNQDDDDHQAEPVRRLKEQVKAADGVLIATPEYNRSIPGVLKNAMDHASRPYGQSAWKGKPVGVIGTSPGPVATAAAQNHLRAICHALDMPVMGHPEAYIQWKAGLVQEDGTVGPASHDFLNGWMVAFVAHVGKHAAA